MVKRNSQYTKKQRREIKSRAKAILHTYVCDGVRDKRKFMFRALKYICTHGGYYNQREGMREGTELSNTKKVTTLRPKVAASPQPVVSQHIDGFSHTEIVKMNDEDFLKLSPFEKRSCFDCGHLISACSWWCSNKKAIEFRGTSIAGGIKCKFWKPDWSVIDEKLK